MKVVQKGQLKLNASSGKTTGCSSMMENWKFSNTRMREVISHMVMVHELPFNFVEYELFNVMMKEANPEFCKISRASIRQDCISSYELGKKRLQKLLNTVNRVSIKTDMWTSAQNIHYMVLTCHFVDSDFELHKRILSFVDVPPPFTGVGIYDCLFKCLKDWNIVTKVATLTVDNARTNDVVARKLKKNLNLQKKLPLNGKLLHVRCTTHILNLLVQDGLSEIQHIIHNVRESVKHVGAHPGRLHLFSDLMKQLKMKKRHLILDGTTRWNATYAMLSMALEFKEGFANYSDRDSSYTTLPSNDDWKKVKDVCIFLSLFNEATKVISGSEYPTSNLFLIELYAIKEALDIVALKEKDWMKSMASKMKEKFDKYWGSSNLLICIGSVMDPRYKMELINLSFQSIYSPDQISLETELVKDALEELFQEYVGAHKESNVVQSTSNGSGNEIGTGTSYSNSSSSFMTSRFGQSLKSGSAKYAQHIRSVDSVERVKSKLAIYLDEGVYICEPGATFDALWWWKISLETELVKDALEELFQEYVGAHKESNVVQSTSNGSGNEIGTGTSYSNSSSSFMTSRFGQSLKSGSAKYAQHIRSVDSVERVKSKLAIYLDEGVYICEPGATFDALWWWKENRLKYRILSKMAADILSVPITTVASESAFSAGGRVIDPHRSCLGTKMVDMLVCGADWYRHHYGLNKMKIKENDDITRIEL